MLFSMKKAWRKTPYKQVYTRKEEITNERSKRKLMLRKLASSTRSIKVKTVKAVTVS